MSKLFKKCIVTGLFITLPCVGVRRASKDAQGISGVKGDVCLGGSMGSTATFDRSSDTL